MWNMTLTELIRSYYEDAELEDIAARSRVLAPEVADRYYSNELDADEFIAALRDYNRSH